MKWVSYFLFLVFFSSSVFSVVSVEGIERVRQRTESASTPLSEADKAEIDKFILAALNDMFLSKTSEEITRTRRQLLVQKGTKDLSLYASTYLTQLREHLRTSAFEAIGRIEDAERRLMVRRNLIILVAELRSLLLVEFGLDRIEDPDAVIRFWSVKSLTRPSIAEQLNSEVTTNPEAAAQIYEKLQIVIAKEKQPEILSQVADFAAAWADDRAADLLGKLAGRRMEAYRTCSVRHEWLDGRILNALAEKYKAQRLPAEKAETARSFAELLAMVMQRLMQEKERPEGEKTLSEESVFQMITVLVETEERILPKLEIPAAGMKRIIERGEDLRPVFEELFGTESRRGTLRSQLGFEYSRDPAGGATAGPPTLPACPKPESGPAAG